MNLEFLLGYLFVFIASIFTQVIVPFPLDITMFGMVKIGYVPWILVLLAITGLTVGALADFCLGKFGLRIFPWFRKEEKSKWFKKSKKMYKKYGQWTLLITFFPFVGKYFPLMAGIMKLSNKRFVFLYVIGKVLYYILLLFVLKISNTVF